MPSSTLTPILYPDGRKTREWSVFSVRPPAELPDGFVEKALEKVAKDVGSEEKVVDDLLCTKGLTAAAARCTAKLNLGGIDRTQRLLLSNRRIYAAALEKGLKRRTGKSPLAVFGDTTALVDFVLRTLDAGARKEYAKLLVEKTIDERGLFVKDAVKTKVSEAVSARELPVGEVAVADLIATLIDQNRSTLPEAVDKFVKDSKLEDGRFTTPVRLSMIRRLQELGITEFADHTRPYFALAYEQATRGGDGATADPIDAVRQKGMVADWDFAVDTFDTVEEQGVVPQNILAAGALDYIYELGERLGIFRLADALVLRWASGAFDAPAGEASADLYRYWKLRSERVSPEERGMMYRRILSKGDGKLLNGMVENEAFPGLWGTLMQNTTEYIRRSEENSSPDRPVSRQPLFQATKQLQYNLTEHATGMAHMQIQEMYFHLKEAKAVLEHAIDSFSTGSRKSLWTVIERASREWFNESPNIAAVRSAAVDGNRVFQWIANYDAGSVVEDDFRTFVDAAEAWILTQAESGETAPGATNGDDETTVDEDVNADEADVDSDWDK